MLDRRQRRHREFVEFFETWRGPVASTEAVLTEATHLLAHTAGGAISCVEFFLQGGAVLVPSTRTTLGRCRELMAKYADVPMDFADATLVVLAEELGAEHVLTADRRDFGIYRCGRRGDRAFRIVP